MDYFKKSLSILITGIILFGLTGCGENTNKVITANAKPLKETVKNDNSVNLDKLNVTLPSSWTKRGNENEIFFDDENKQTVGGILLIGYYGDYNSLPNHSEILNIEDINTSLGKGKLFTLKRNYPAASNNSETCDEIHAVIPINKNNMAYDIWLKGTKDMVLKILKSIKYIEG